MTRFIHPVAAAIGLATILTFWTSTAAVELFGTHEQLVWVKTAIPWGLLVLVPALAATGGTGFALGRRWKSPVVDAKRRRMPFIAANGLLVLAPCALALGWMAAAGRFGATFTAIQALELVAGAVNITLMSLSMRDGLSLRRRPARS